MVDRRSSLPPQIHKFGGASLADGPAMARAWQDQGVAAETFGVARRVGGYECRSNSFPEATSRDAADRGSP